MSYSVRKGTPGDIAVFSHFRAEMFRVFWDGPIDEKALAARDEEFFLGLVERGEAAFWLAETEDGEPVASAAVVVTVLPPKPWALDGRSAYICSMFTDPGHRRQGLARKLFAECMEYAKGMGASTAVLHAAPMGKGLYESFGFADTNEMRITLDNG